MTSMTSSGPPLSRHDLAWLAPRWRDLLCGSPGAGAIAAAERWTERRLPAVVARRVAGDGAGVRLGIPFGRGRERQASVVVAREAIARTSPPLELSAALPSAPAPWRARLRTLDEDARAAGLVMRTYGSLAWQHLTGEERVTATSDADLLVAVSDAPALERALTLLRRHDAAGAPRLDGEVVLPGGRGVAWRELFGSADRLIVKSARSVVLGSRAEVLASLGVEETVDVEAIAALEDELRLDPKPGLVGPRDRGAHPDMDAGTFVASLDALRGSFRAAALAGRRRAPFRILRAIGVGAERRMLRATGGVNTHRGAIFALGLLAAAAGRAASSRAGLTRDALRDEARELGGEVRRALPPDAHSNGGRAAARHRVGGARGEAEAAFPHVFEVALPALDRALARGAPAPAARIQALMELIAVLPDTNLLHRGGTAGLAFARAAAREFLAAGGVHRARWQANALEMHRAFVTRRLSPGGSADLLAAALFVERVCGKGAVP